MRNVRWGTVALWVVTIFGFAYLYIPLLTIALFSFNQPDSRFNTSWNQFTWDNWTNAFESSDYTEAFVVSLRVAFVACTIATVLGALIALALARYRILGGTWLNLLLVLPLTTPEIVFGASLFTLFFNQGVSRGFWTIVIAHTMFCLSFVALTVKARIRGLDWSLEDAAAGRPWPDPMPFPVQVIGVVTNLDSLGHEYVTRFHYHDAYYDPIDTLPADGQMWWRKEENAA